MISLTIGNFDGVHRGHQSLIAALNQTGLKTVALTFLNHSKEILAGSAPVLLSTSILKIALLEECGISQIIAMPFTQNLSMLSFEEFLAPYNISQLILGEGASLGKDCQGTADALRLLGVKRGFQVKIIPKMCIDSTPISSSFIRRLVASGQLKEAENLLGRPYCFYHSGTSPKYPIALPPDGTYPVWIHSIGGIAAQEMTIQENIPQLPKGSPLLVSFGQNLNPLIFKRICQTYHAELSACRT